MSGVEEPPSKMSKYEEYLETEGEECMEEGQEEWLSEGVLTDDDYAVPDEDKTDSNLNTSQEDQDTMQSLQDADIMDQSASTIDHDNQKPGNVEQNIEETLNNLEGVKKGDLPDELDAFLIRKADGKVLEAKVKEEYVVPKKEEENDGNDTDDLLRMLGEGDQKAKKKTLKLVKTEKKEDPASSDDDEFIYEHNKVKTLKVAKNALIKRAPATKAVPEDMSDGDDETDMSTDEGSTVQRMFEVKKLSPMPPMSAKSAPSQKKVVKHVVEVNSNFSKIAEKPELKMTKQLNAPKSILKPTTPKPNNVPLKTPVKSVEIKTPAPFKPLEKHPSKSEKTKSDQKESTLKGDDFDEIIDEEEFLEGDEIDLDEEEFGDNSEDEDSKKQRIMRPERMDEEVPSDAESRSEGGSLYDELPSSDSEDLEDWFTLDIRAERAGDYLPLLGSKARELLLAERRRVSTRVATLRQSLSALTDSARRQADQLRSAAMALAEIDDTLRAA